MAKKKAFDFKLLNKVSLNFEPENEWDDDYVYLGDASQTVSCCGICEVEGLDNNANSKQQARLLYEAMINTRTGVVMITDVRSDNADKIFAAAKAIGVKGAEGINPKTKSKVTLWTINKDMIGDIYYYDDRKKKSTTTKPKAKAAAKPKRIKKAPLYGF